MPPLAEEDRKVPVPLSYTELGEKISQKVVPALLIAIKGKSNLNVVARNFSNHSSLH